MKIRLLDVYKRVRNTAQVKPTTRQKSKKTYTRKNYNVRKEE